MASIAAMPSARSRRTLAETALTLEVALLLAMPAVAGAQEPGVIRDPDSPAGKEYALPFDAARRAGVGPGASEREGVAPPFGIGIRPPGSDSGEDSAEDGDGSPGGSAGGPEANGRDTPRRTLPPAATVDGGGTSSVTMAILAAVLLGGGLLGAGLRIASRRRVDPT